MNPLARLRRAVLGPPRRRGSDFYGLAERVPRVPAAELAVAEAALTNGGPIAERLVQQLRVAGDVWRRRSDDGGYELRISTTDDLTVPDVPRSGWTSDWMPITTAGDARVLELRLFVFGGGSLSLLGRALDGRPWPLNWRERPEDLAKMRASAPWLRLPTPAELRTTRAAAAATIEAWLDDDAVGGQRGGARANSPATDETIAAFAAREGFALPEAYQALLRVADGIDVGSLIVLGTRDAYRLDLPGPTRLVIAPPTEDGALVLAESGEIVWIELGDETSDGRVEAPDLRRWVSARLAGESGAANAG